MKGARIARFVERCCSDPYVPGCQFTHAHGTNARNRLFGLKS